MGELDKALIIELTQEIKKLRQAIAPPTPPELPGPPPPVMRIQEYYKLLARKRIDVKTSKTEPYEIKHKGDPKIILITAYGDDVQVNFDNEVSEDCPWVFDKQTRWWPTEGITKIYGKSHVTDLTTYPNGVYIEVWG